MKSNKEYVEEDGLKNIYDLLEKSDIKKFIDDDDGLETDINFDDADLTISEKYTFPGQLKFRMDGIKLHLFMDLKAPINSNNEITIEDIKVKIEEYGSFCEGQADWDLIRDVYTRVIFNGEIIPETKIATGKLVKFDIPEHLIIRDDLTIDYTPKIIDGEKVDFHHIKSFLVVGKDDFLGDIIPMTPGVDGLDLLGHTIKAPKKFINYLSKGDNVYSKGGKIYSDIDGSFKIINNKLNVDPVLSIPNDIDYSTGDIEFSGDVNVLKSIREGFSVKVDRDLYIGESIEPADISCGNSIYVKHGIIGSDKYTIYCSNSINVMHVENANIRCNGSISIRNSITNSNICCLDRLIMEESSSIIGGKYNFQNGIVTGHIGNKIGVETHIKLGVDYKIEEKLRIIQETSKMLIQEMTLVQDKVSFADSKEIKFKLKYLFLSLRNRQNSLNNYSRSLLSRLDKNENSKLVVHGTIYPGTYIEICHISYVVSKKLSKIKFYLNKEDGEIKYTSF